MLERFAVAIAAYRCPHHPCAARWASYPPWLSVTCACGRPRVRAVVEALAELLVAAAEMILLRLLSSIHRVPPRVWAGLVVPYAFLSRVVRLWRSVGFSWPTICAQYSWSPVRLGSTNKRESGSCLVAYGVSLERSLSVLR